MRAMRSESGATAVEFALILPLLILLVFGIVSFGFAFNRMQGLHAAAREGARLGSVPGVTVGQVQSRVTDALDGVSVTLNGAPAVDACDGSIGDTVVVTVSADTDLEIPLWGSQTITMTGRGEFRCEV